MNGHWKYGCSQSAIQDFINLADDAPSLTDQWMLSVNGGAFMHDMFILTQDENGNITGKGGYPAGTGPDYSWPYNWEVTGKITGNAITMTIEYENGYTAKMDGTIALDWNSMGGGAGTGGVTSWTATRVP